MALADILGNAASGGLFGLLGNAVSFGLSYFQKKQEHSQWCERSRLEAELNAAKTAGEVAVARESGAAAAFTASVNAEGALKGEHKWVTSFRAFTRPGLTWLGLTASVVTALFGIGGPAVDQLSAYSGMMLAWWFGQRAMDKTNLSWGGGSINGRVSSSANK